MGALAAELFQAELAGALVAFRARSSRQQPTTTPAVVDADIIGAALGMTRRRAAPGERRRAVSLYD